MHQEGRCSLEIDIFNFVISIILNVVSSWMSKPENSFHCHQLTSCCRASGHIFCSFLDVIHADSPQSTVSTVRVDHEKCQKLIIILSLKYREWQHWGPVSSSVPTQFKVTSLFK